jgi:hypothetical protein
VKEAKEAFFKIFNKALDGLIETAYLEDTKVIIFIIQNYFFIFFINEAK